MQMKAEIWIPIDQKERHPFKPWENFYGGRIPTERESARKPTPGSGEGKCHEAGIQPVQKETDLESHAETKELPPLSSAVVSTWGSLIWKCKSEMFQNAKKKKKKFKVTVMSQVENSTHDFVWPVKALLHYKYFVNISLGYICNIFWNTNEFWV